MKAEVVLHPSRDNIYTAPLVTTDTTSFPVSDKVYHLGAVYFLLDPWMTKLQPLRSGQLCRRHAQIAFAHTTTTMTALNYSSTHLLHC